jgi:hypothetical protein
VFQVLTHIFYIFFVWTFCHVFFVEMLGQLKCVSYYSEGFGVFSNDEGTPSMTSAYKVKTATCSGDTFRKVQLVLSELFLG